MIYFLRHVETGLIKIGVTRNLKSRLSSLLSDYGRLEILCLIEGDALEEQKLHTKFYPLNVRGVLRGREWFSPDSAIFEYIENTTTPRIPIPEMRALPERRGINRKPRKKVTVNLVNNLPKLVKDYQKRRWVKQSDIAAALGLHPTVFSRYVNSFTSRVDFDVWQRMANFFGVEGSEIFNVKPETDKSA